jgi:flagellar biosynthesis anti-sigma factor FlgM
MKVGNDKQPGMLEGLLRSNQLKASKEKGLEGKVEQNTTDKVELSSRKEEIQRLTDRVKAAPDVRQDKVDRIADAIKTETYNIKGELVARSILKSQLLDQIL